MHLLPILRASTIPTPTQATIHTRSVRPDAPRGFTGMGQSVGPIELSGQLAAIVEVAKEMKRIIRVLMIVAMIVSVERANAETNQPCSKSDTPIKCFEGSAGNGIYCSFPEW
jgi:hypothetical protein